MNLGHKPVILLYTMTSGLGDYLILGDVMQKVETLLPQTQCLMVHRENPHVKLWPYGKHAEKFCNIYSLNEIYRLINKLRTAKKNGTTVFGLQMAPGSLQGFFWYSLLKKLDSLDYIVDFNLINADIITPPKGDYLLDIHLNQIRDLFNVGIPQGFYHLNLPLKFAEVEKREREEKIRIGIHPWSRRGHYQNFIWPFEKWQEIIDSLLKKQELEIVVFGRDQRFDEFRASILRKFGNCANLIQLKPSHSVLRLIETIQGLDIVLSVNTSVVHIGYALRKRTIVLSGPTLDCWTPKAGNIKTVFDQKALFHGSDKFVNDERFPSVARIEVNDVLKAALELISEVKRSQN